MRSATLLVLASTCLSAQSPHNISPADLQEGQRLFLAHCPACHGAEARGAMGPDLVSGAFKHGGTASEIARNIRDGISGTAMPAFPLPANQPALIAEWLLSLSRGPGDDRVTGDAASGRQLFFGAGG